MHTHTNNFGIDRAGIDVLYIMTMNQASSSASQLTSKATAFIFIYKVFALVLPNTDIPRSSVCLWVKYVTSKLECLPKSKPDPLWLQFREDPEGRQESCADNKNQIQQAMLLCEQSVRT